MVDLPENMRLHSEEERRAFIYRAVTLGDTNVTTNTIQNKNLVTKSKPKKCFSFCVGEGPIASRENASRDQLKKTTLYPQIERKRPIRWTKTQVVNIWIDRGSFHA